MSDTKYISNKRALVNLYKDILCWWPAYAFLYNIVYQQQHKNRDQKSYPCFPSKGSEKNIRSCKLSKYYCKYLHFTLFLPTNYYSEVKLKIIKSLVEK